VEAPVDKYSPHFAGMYGGGEVIKMRLHGRMYAGVGGSS
jgi:hypothetical protein